MMDNLPIAPVGGGEVDRTDYTYFVGGEKKRYLPIPKRKFTEDDLKEIAEFKDYLLTRAEFKRNLDYIMYDEDFISPVEKSRMRLELHRYASEEIIQRNIRKSTEETRELTKALKRFTQWIVILTLIMVLINLLSFIF